MQTQFPSQFTAIWEAISEHISAQVTKDTYERWFKAVTLTAADENDIILTAPNKIYQFWIESNYMALLQSSIASVLGAPRRIQFAVAEEPSPAPKSITSAPEPAPEPEPVPEQCVSEDEEDIAHSHLLKDAPADSKTHSRARDTNGAANSAPCNGGMNPRNTFASFVVGANNQFAHAASLAVSQSPARTYNPLFIYGRVGLGKTHQQGPDPFEKSSLKTKAIWLSLAAAHIWASQ